MSAEDPVNQPETTEEKSDVQYYKFSIGKLNLSLNLTYMKSMLGIFNAVEIVLSLLGLISIAAGFQPACDFRYGSSYGFYDFIGGTVFVTRFILYVLFVVSIEEKWCFKFVPWLIARVLVLIVYSLFFFIASIAVAANVCYQDGNKAAAAFGFILTAVLVADLVFSVRALRADHDPTDNRFLIFIGVRRKEAEPPAYDVATANVTSVSEDEPKY